jgi:hypothetical protein
LDGINVIKRIGEREGKISRGRLQRGKREERDAMELRGQVRSQMEFGNEGDGCL